MYVKRHAIPWPPRRWGRKKATLAFGVDGCGVKHIASKSGGSSKTYVCSGFEGPGKGCSATIQAQKQKPGEWECTMENVARVNCTGGDPGGIILANGNIVASTVVSNRVITCPALKKDNRGADR